MPSTIHTYLFELSKFSSWLEVNGGEIRMLTRFDVQNYLFSLEEKGMSANTLQKIYACLCTFAKFLQKPELVEEIRIPKILSPLHIAPKALNRQEKNKLLRVVERDGNLRNIAITYTLLMTGIRVSELVALNKEDIEIRDRSGSLIIRNGKGNIARYVPLAAEVRYRLGKYLETRLDGLSPLFLSNFKQRISSRSVQYMLHKYEVHPHLLRHTFCRQLVMEGVDIATVADLAGHLDLNITRRYAKPSEEELQEAINRLTT